MFISHVKYFLNNYKKNEVRNTFHTEKMFSLDFGKFTVYLTQRVTGSYNMGLQVGSLDLQI